ncbi:MAG: bifunctional aspartate kinase/homoserine dehydrogenase I [Dokdonella sp.]
MIAHKFGGSSLASAECFGKVDAILRARAEPDQIIVVSAMQGVTDALLTVATAATERSDDWRGQWQALREKHLATATELLARDSSATHDWLQSSFADLADVLHALSVLGVAAPQAIDMIQGCGELWSSRLLAAKLASSGDDCGWLDARGVLVVSHAELGVDVDWPRSVAQLAKWRCANLQRRVVITGFIASDYDGHASTLGRNGSDYSGAIFAALFGARELHIWTDVDGVLSADPRLVPEAVALASMSYEEAFELAYFGAKVIHPQTMLPALALDLPVIIRNTFAPEHPGTRISTDSSAEASPVKGLSLADQLALVNVEGAGMIGVPGTAERVFGALHDAQVSVVMISQGSSEHSICCVVRGADAARAQSALDNAFARELVGGQIQSITIQPRISVLAAVGDGMSGTPGTAARLFAALGRSRINIRAIAQGASERNISVALDSADAARALRAAHSGFYLSPQAISVGIIGPGNVGRELVAQIVDASARLHHDTQLDLRVRGIATRRTMWLDDRGIIPDDWSTRLANGEAADLDRFTTQVTAAHLPHAVIIDCSASSHVADRYAEWIAAGIHVVTPNKQAGSGSLLRWQAIRTAAANSGARWRYEATVGAGLPIIQTLRDLIDTGDSLLAVDGILSGTLAWLFNRYDGSLPFSALVREAHELGYTEPDPRDDLSGLDVARKLVILAREAGMDLSLDDVIVEGLVPAALADISRDALFDRLTEIDVPLAEKLAQTQAKGEVLRYVARLDCDGKASVGLVALPNTHAFANLRLTDNIVQFTTRRYLDNPLIVQGPGAGPEVTAAGVFADLLRVGAAIGARL